MRPDHAAALSPSHLFRRAAEPERKRPARTAKGPAPFSLRLSAEERDPRNFTLAQWQQAKRIGKDPRAIKQTLQDCWAASDSQAAFQQALKSHGFLLARGDRRSFVAVDMRCEVFAVPRWVGLPTKAARARLTDPAALPSVQEAKAEMAQTIAARLNTLRDQQSGAIKARLERIADQRAQLARRQAARRALHEAQDTRWQAELRQRQARYSRGFKGMLDRLTGRHRHIRERNERETLEAYTRDQQEKDALIFRQLEERRALQDRIARLERFAERSDRRLSEDITRVQDLAQAEPEPRAGRSRARRASQDRPGYER